MPKVLIAYFSHGGNTRKMAEALSLAVNQAGCQAQIKKINDTTLDDMRGADGIILGSPCYFGNMAAPVKQFLDDSIALFGKGELVGKPAGAFASTGGIGGGGELTILAMLSGLLIHGMVVQGLRKGGHFGPLAIGEPDQRVLEECQRYGEQFAGLVKKLSA
jgi:NAD(P)H dehydrogenase (quinone)